MTDPKASLLIVEDDPDVAEMLNAYFNIQAYEVRTVNWGEDGVRACLENPPDLVILDIRLPDIDGFEVASRLRHNRRTKEIPIIFLTEKRARADRLQGLELGADDYITKPFDVQELRLRVRNALRRATLGTLTNPVTNLPEGALVEERLEECLKSSDWAIILVSLVNLGKYRETYGFVAADDVLRAVNLMLNNAKNEVGGKDDFIGHLQADDFILVTSPSNLPMMTERIKTRLEQALDYFYPLKDRERRGTGAGRLAIRLAELTAGTKPFTKVEALKTALLNKLA